MKFLMLYVSCIKILLNYRLVIYPNGSNLTTKCGLFFGNCIGALDGLHVPILVPVAEQSAWRNRKGWILQNVLIVCDFNMNFVYILPRWEGSAYNS